MHSKTSTPIRNYRTIVDECAELDAAIEHLDSVAKLCRKRKGAVIPFPRQGRPAR